MRKVWPPQQLTEADYSELLAALTGTGPEHAPKHAKPDCDHKDIDTRAKQCRDCGEPVTDEQADAAAERWDEQHYGTGRA